MFVVPVDTQRESIYKTIETTFDVLQRQMLFSLSVGVDDDATPDDHRDP